MTPRLAQRLRAARPLRFAAALALFASFAPVRLACGQGSGIATTEIRGHVRSADGAAVIGAEVRVVHLATGRIASARTRNGGFLFQGLEPGGAYIIEVRHLGFRPFRSEPLHPRLGKPVSLQLELRRIAIGLDTIVVASQAAARGRMSTTIPDSLIHRLPTLDRNFLDFVVLAPQVSSRVGFQRRGMSSAGANLRFNSYLVNGADERFVSGNVSAAANAGKSIPLDAVQEYQVLVAPYDVRYGDFAGALVNTVTRSGTNEVHGSVFAYWRNDRFTRGDSIPYEQVQYGFSVGGPIIRDRAHFFVAPELQHLASPATGPYLGQSSERHPPVPVRADDLARLESIMRGYGLSAGSGGLVQVATPLRNLFGRVDVALPEWRSRAMAFATYARAQDDRFGRTAADTFPLSSYEYSVATTLRLTSLQLYTDLPGSSGAHHELVVSAISDRQQFAGAVQQPLVRVFVPGVAGNRVAIATGTAEAAQGRFGSARSFTVRSGLSLPLAAKHLLQLGAQAEQFEIARGGVVGGYGVWTFPDIDALERGVPERYELRRESGTAVAPLRGTQHGAHVGSEWRVSERLRLSVGMRADLMDFTSRAPYDASIDSIFARRTDEMPRSRVHLAPRLGFAWHPSRDSSERLRGGVGIFTGRPPRAWIVPAVTNAGVAVLQCGNRPGDAGLPPPFEPDYRLAPTICATGSSTVGQSREVNLLSPRLRMAQALRASVAYDRRLPWGVMATTEALASRYLSDFMFVNHNLVGPQAVDHSGRVLYGTHDPSGIARPLLRSGHAGVIELANTSRNYSVHLSTRAERPFGRGMAGVASYTYSRTRDVQSPSRVNMPGLVLWADARATGRRHDDVRLGTSLNDLPHRAIAAFTYTTPSRRRPVAFSFYYVGESGSPFTYVARGAGRRGDLNADGSNANDPIYVPRDAALPREILFTGVSDTVGADHSPAAQAARIAGQRAAFEQFITRTPCLARQRGRILERNSCREPWSHTTIASVRQTLPFSGRSVDAQVDVFNVLNVINRRWGHLRVAQPLLLEHVAHTADDSGPGQPVFRFDTARTAWITRRTESAFQLQLAVRYRF